MSPRCLEEIPRKKELFLANMINEVTEIENYTHGDLFLENMILSVTKLRTVINALLKMTFKTEY